MYAARSIQNAHSIVLEHALFLYASLAIYIYM
jgi:hypothetical protein